MASRHCTSTTSEYAAPSGRSVCQATHIAFGFFMPDQAACANEQTRMTDRRRVSSTATPSWLV